MAKVAIVDDSVAAVDLLGSILKDESHSILPCTKTDDLESKVSSFSPDIIFLDIVMPDRSGYDVLRSFKRNNKLKDIPVIFTSTKQESTDIKWGLKQGAVDYITKPFTKDRVVSAISSCLSKV